MNKPEDVNTIGSADQQLQPVTLEYARFTEQLTFAQLPDDVALTCQEQAVATIGSCLAGTLMPGARSIERALGIFGDGQAATLFGRKEKMPAPGAALFNAATGQIIEWDDWVLISHVGACVIPVAFAVGELTKSSGKDVLTAIAIGNEIAGRTSRAIQRGGYLGNGMPNHQVEAPLVAGKLMKLDQRALARSVSHSAYMAMENCFLGWASDSKTLVNGLPAMWGIASASLAQEGLIGNLDMVEHPAGYLSTVSEIVDHDELLKGLGQDWITRTLNTKRYPSCAYNLPAIECALRLHKRLAGETGAIRTIHIRAPGVTLYVSGRYKGFQPDIFTKIKNGELSHMGLCFDAGYAVAAALVDGRLTYKQFLDDCIFAPEVQRLYRSIRYSTDPDMQVRYYSDYQYGSTVTVELEDGTILEETCPQLLGARDRPFDHAEKFREGAEGVLSPTQTEEALEALRNLPAVDDIREVTAILRPA